MMNEMALLLSDDVLDYVVGGNKAQTKQLCNYMMEHGLWYPEPDERRAVQRLNERLTEILQYHYRDTGHYYRYVETEGCNYVQRFCCGSIEPDGFCINHGELMEIIIETPWIK